jgi:hypothetical protein
MTILIIEMVTCWNFLSHHYSGITEEQLFDSTKKMTNVKKFVTWFKKKDQEKDCFSAWGSL